MSALDDLITEFDPDSYLEALTPYHQRLINDLRSAGNSEWEIIDLWLRQSGPSTNFPMGSGGRVDFTTRFRAELHALICGDDRYEPERKRILSQGDITQAALVGALAFVLGPALGTAAVFVAPPIAVALAVIGRVGIRAWCSEEASQPESER